MTPASRTAALLPTLAAIAALTLPSPTAAAKMRQTPAPIAKANAAALQGAKDAALFGALHQFAYEVGQLYQVQAAPQRITDIALEPGEQLLSVSAGDTTRWIVGDATSGKGATAQAHVLVKPNAPGLSTNLLIMTDRRVYHVELRSSLGASMSAVSWRYPNALRVAGLTATGELDGDEASHALDQVARGVAVEGLNFRYRIKGDKTDWRPLRAFDDGRRVFIQFPETMATSDAPPLFVTGEDGPELVNYRVRGRFYVVDRLFERAELRIGDKTQKVVRIERLKTATRAAGEPADG